MIRLNQPPADIRVGAGVLIGACLQDINVLTPLLLQFCTLFPAGGSHAGIFEISALVRGAYLVALAPLEHSLVLLLAAVIFYGHLDSLGLGAARPLHVHPSPLARVQNLQPPLRARLGEQVGHVLRQGGEAVGLPEDEVVILAAVPARPAALAVIAVRTALLPPVLRVEAIIPVEPEDALGILAERAAGSDLARPVARGRPGAPEEGEAGRRAQGDRDQEGDATVPCSSRHVSSLAFFAAFSVPLLSR
eukprot:CAMPEP_0113538558 /NCGR_PEP_ID=MMETSP0015_2-20120614/7430_1 /TAXON_ID=2838 /ORGANISM="Odontella" /LENGTH=247 /DNA_ID=CAMNT_0000438141 /DNA_START=357 /DNA_END=1097 /DNA_ORIENTATION=+ /assembly_acc=CAM_ASM_000160